MNASQSASPICSHERRPGTTVCLHCRHAERTAAAGRRKKLMFRGSALAIVLAVGAVTASMSANALRDRFTRPASTAVPANVVSSATAEPSRDTTATSVAPLPVVQQGDVAPAATTPVVAPLSPVIAFGESVLEGGAGAVRSDSGVTVSFDVPMLRTRLPEKFEAFLRSTLRQVYGPAIDSTLAAIPVGAIAAQGNLVNELPTRGIRLPLADGWQVAVFPEIRPGQDGPLVIRYRTSVAKN